MNLQDKIKAIIDESGIPSTKFADTIGVGRPIISHILSGRNKPSFDVIQKIIINFPELGSNWFIDGEVLDTSILPELAKNKGIETETKPISKPSELNEKETVKTSTEKINSQELVKPSETPIETTKERRVDKIVIHYTDGSMEVMKGVSHLIY